MEILIPILLLLLGLVLIIKGGDVFVDAASWMAEVSGVPRLIVGATVVSIATTLPELLVSSFASAEGKVDMAIGNAVGSVTANVGLIMAIALIFMPMAIRRQDYMLKSLLMIGASLFIVVFGFGGSMGLLPSLALLLLFIAAEIDNIRAARNAIAEVGKEERPAVNAKIITVNIVKFVLGAAAMAGGARLLVDNGSALATLCGVPERIISVTLIAIGTSLPELVTTVTAIVKKQATLSIGNIIGANIIDLTLILPLCAAISGGALPVTRQVATADLPFCLIVCCIAVIPTLISGKFRKTQGFIMLAVYLVYLAVTCFVIA